jgi:hypothetical protein
MTAGDYSVWFHDVQPAPILLRAIFDNPLDRGEGSDAYGDR